MTWWRRVWRRAPDSLLTSRDAGPVSNSAGSSR